MLHLRELGLLDTNTLTANAIPLGKMLDQWKVSERRQRLRTRLHEVDSVDPDTVIFDPSSAAKAGMTRTLIFPKGNLAPDGSVVKATTIDPSMLKDNVFDFRGQARVFYSEASAIAAIKGQGSKQVEAGNVLVLAGCGPSGTGMEAVSYTHLTLPTIYSV